MATEYTPNYNLDLYVGTDKPNLRDQYNSAITKIDGQMKTNADNITNQSANIVTIQSQIATLTSDFESLQSWQTDVEGQLSTISSTVTGLQTNYEDLSGVVSGHTSTIGELQTSVDGYDSRITSVENTLTTTSGQIETINSNISTIQSNISTINSSLSSLSDSAGQIRAIARCQFSSGSVPASGTIYFPTLNSSTFVRGGSDPTSYIGLASGNVAFQLTHSGFYLVWASLNTSASFQTTTEIAVRIVGGTTTSTSDWSNLGATSNIGNSVVSMPTLLNIAEDTYYVSAAYLNYSSSAISLDLNNAGCRLCCLYLGDN